MNHNEYGEYIDGLIESAMVKVMSSVDDIDIDVESYEEIKSLSEELLLDD